MVATMFVTIIVFIGNPDCDSDDNDVSYGNYHNDNYDKEDKEDKDYFIC